MAASIAFEPPSIQKAWQAFLQHIPVVLVSWVGSIVLSLLAVLAYGLIIVAVSSIIGSSDAALGLGAVLAQLVQLPFSILASLLSVLLVAVPALYYERGEVVTISTAAQLLTGRWWRYVLAGLFFSLVTTIGFLLCILPGIAVALVTPVLSRSASVQASWQSAKPSESESVAQSVVQVLASSLQSVAVQAASRTQEAPLASVQPVAAWRVLP